MQKDFFVGQSFSKTNSSKMFVKLSPSKVIVILAVVKLAEGTPTCAQISSMRTDIKKALAGNSTTGDLAPKALQLGLPFLVWP